MASSGGSYYDFFDNNTNNGVVFDQDLSALDDLPVKTLTDIEVVARERWLKLRRKIQKEYSTKQPPPITTTTQLLEQRILAPCLVTNAASSRSKPEESRKGRRYPRKISEWVDFAAKVAAFQIEEKAVNFLIPPFVMSMVSGDHPIEFRDERQEEIFLANCLNGTLYKQGLIGMIVSSGELIGRPDVCVANVRGYDDYDDDESDNSREGEDGVAAEGDEDDSRSGEEEDDHRIRGEDISIVCEFKSTHNLTLPMTARSVCDAYNTAYLAVYEEQAGHTKEWSRVCHPIGQLLGYLVDNKKRIGVLSSGTRSYFFKISQDKNGDEVVQISDPMFVGQKGYLKAWVYVHWLTNNQGPELNPEALSWKITSKKSNTPPKKGSRNQPKRNAKGGPSGEAAQSGGHNAKVPRLDGGRTSTTTLPSVPFSEIEIVRSLGQGRNGTVFLAEWQGKRVALKQFDVDKSGDAFEHEVEAYMAVRDGWGRLVPTPFFVSQSWSGGARFLALQVGRMPRPSDDTSNWREILDTLENEYGIRHEDCDGHKNLLFIPKGDQELLVAVDLEDVTWINRSHHGRG